MKILAQEYNLQTDRTVHQVKNIIFIIDNFQEEHLQSVIENINQQQLQSMYPI